MAFSAAVTASPLGFQGEVPGGDNCGARRISSSLMTFGHPQGTEGIKWEGRLSLFSRNFHSARGKEMVEQTELQNLELARSCSLWVV